MPHKSAENSHSSVFDVKVRILHAIEEHKQVLISADEGVELRVQVLKHCHSYAIIIVSGCSHKELMEKFVDYPDHDSAEPLE